RLVDLGAGEGRITELFARESFHAIGIDFLIGPLRAAVKSETHKDASFIQADAFELPFDSNTFSTAVDYGLLHHVRKTDWPRYRSFLTDLLVPGALYFVSVFHESDNHANRKNRKWVYHRGHYDRFFEEEDLSNCLGDQYKQLESGLVDDGCHTFLHSLFRYRPDDDE
ncbi:MAG: class I SAM-dependent methyltransferase, partial [bacterium]